MAAQLDTEVLGTVRAISVGALLGSAENSEEEEDEPDDETEEQPGTPLTVPPWPSRWDTTSNETPRPVPHNFKWHCF